MTEYIEVKLSPSYEVDGGLWVEVDGIYHICPMVIKENSTFGKLSEDTLCGLTKIGFDREWGYRLAAGQKACKCCVEKGKYTKNKHNNMQDYELVLRKKKRSNNDNQSRSEQ